MEYEILSYLSVYTGFFSAFALAGTMAPRLGQVRAGDGGASLPLRRK